MTPLQNIDTTIYFVQINQTTPDNWKSESGTNRTDFVWKSPSPPQMEGLEVVDMTRAHYFFQLSKDCVFYYEIIPNSSLIHIHGSVLGYKHPS